MPSSVLGSGDMVGMQHSPISYRVYLFISGGEMNKYIFMSGDAKCYEEK